MPTHFRLLPITLSLLFFTSCSLSTPSVKGVEIACAFVEAYQETKVLTLTLPPNQALDFIDSVIPSPEQLEESSPLDDTSRQIVVDLRKVMKDWTESFVDYSDTKDKVKFARAGTSLESSINTLARKCESIGWKFKQNWRI